MNTGMWAFIEGNDLEQGDVLRNCLIPVYDMDDLPVDTRNLLDGQFAMPEVGVVPFEESDIVIMTQTCDLQKPDARSAAVCLVSTVHEFEGVNPQFAKKGRWDEVKKGRYVGLYLLAPPSESSDLQDALVIDFSEIYTLPIKYLSRKAEALGVRPRLQSPFREAFSQQFGNYFMRVALP